MCDYNFTSFLYCDGWARKKKKKEKRKVQNLWHLSTSCCALISNPLTVRFRSGFPLNFFFSTKFILWASKALGQKEMFHSFGFTLKSKRYLLRVHSNGVKSTTRVHFSVVFKMNGYGAVLGFLGIKSIHFNQRFAPCSVALKRATDSYPRP